MFIGITESRSRPVISLGSSPALLGLIVLVLFSAAPATIYAGELAPFSSDGCSLFRHQSRPLPHLLQRSSSALAPEEVLKSF